MSLDFLDLVDDMPNELQPLVSRLLTLDSHRQAFVRKIERIGAKLSAEASVGQKCRQMKRLLSCAKSIERIYDQKLELSQCIVEKIKAKERQLTEDYNCCLLSDQTMPFTYGTRSGRTWSQ
ncbi:unnamed protein product [Medioppia subpectinata]|uniref:Inhibitor of growth protein N-terminal histone-binding domain-containing protein n=1 Tax=Medioppia subpectinata TaxID=1979941 RepID=A0A7R9KSX1_9ACAR|nr:unnamed protein product [Medioppia subpectinata]CAG2108048.1 unnamed protein product [Medioppia subpectinata]